MLRCAPRRRATAPAPASPPRHYRAARRRRAPPPRAATARRPTALRAPPPPTPPPCWHTPTASRAPPHRDTTATAPPRRLAAASGGRRACREGRAADLRARDAQASSCSGFLTDETGSSGEATPGRAAAFLLPRVFVADPARTRAPSVGWWPGGLCRQQPAAGVLGRTHVGRQLGLSRTHGGGEPRGWGSWGATGYAPRRARTAAANRAGEAGHSASTILRIL